MTETTVVRARELLGGLQQSLEGDGYRLSIESADPGIKVIVTAGADACEECLVPQAMFEKIVSKTLEKCGLVVGEIEVAYPEAAQH